MPLDNPAMDRQESWREWPDFCENMRPGFPCGLLRASLPGPSLVTWKSHCIANAAVAFTLTRSPEVACAALLTATLPDQLEVFLPLGRHRGATHWLMLWLGVIVAGPFYARQSLLSHLPVALRHYVSAWPAGPFWFGACLFGLALGPFLHVLLDGCSDSGVPVLPFSRQKFKLGLYRTHSHRWRWDLSELLFLVGLLGLCTAVWRMRH